ncbi:hypothetical protein EA696_12475 [Acinetobacter baumannii]|nr:hypothetical protein EA696_12475 [Acinetobacter baumannii]
MISSWSTCHKILHILMFITSFGEQNITYKCCSNFLIHLLLSLIHSKYPLLSSFLINIKIETKLNLINSLIRRFFKGLSMLY